jgi:hypothetical protein
MDTVQVLLELTARFVAERQSWMDTVQVLLELAADKKTSTGSSKYSHSPTTTL